MRKEIVGSTGSCEVVGLEGRMGRVAGSCRRGNKGIPWSERGGRHIMQREDGSFRNKTEMNTEGKRVEW